MTFFSISAGFQNFSEGSSGSSCRLFPYFEALFYNSKNPEKWEMGSRKWERRPWKCLFHLLSSVFRLLSSVLRLPPSVLRLRPPSSKHPTAEHHTHKQLHIKHLQSFLLFITRKIV